MDMTGAMQDADILEGPDGNTTRKNPQMQVTGLQYNRMAERHGEHKKQRLEFQLLVFYLSLQSKVKRELVSSVPL